MSTTSYLAQAAVPLIWLVIACVGALVRTRGVHDRVARLETWQRWWSIAALGCGSLWMFVSFMGVPDVMAEAIGFNRTPFMFEIGFANLGLAYLGLRAASGSYRERMTAAISSGLFLWGATIGHLYQAAANGDNHPGNVGGVLIYDVFIPAVMIILARRWRTAQNHADQARSGDHAPVDQRHPIAG
ncbi:DUF6790 family protein [Amycolatopsis sp. PS_44_ISF1]|uniref:DUF6790 family protein n=1 Tax=Amycolatopsis sp. PS_44_ISF1 TaxID=2974917 RepID=UPI0028E08439|nr:DUF6790 family protein [Amycolatopsis sp. PS_44_ISF1]MDT8911018.1 hypothetical protein [Amycolatopsis sp. PS_44_ISF1]